MTRTRLLIASLLTLVAAVVAVPAIQAAPTCTVGWDGGAGTDSWSHADNWTTNALPGSGDHVCVDQPAGGTVVITGSVSVQSIQGAQTVRLQSGTLSIADTGGEAVLARFEQTGGTLAGGGTLRAGTSFDWTGGEHADGGLLKVDGTAHIHPASSVVLGVARRLETASGSWTAGRIEGRNNAVWTITGTFDMRSEDGWGDFVNHNNSTVTIVRVNPGATLVKTAVTPSSPQDTSFDTDVEFGIDNDGTVRAEAGRLRFGNGSAGATGHFESTTGELVFYNGGSYGQVFQMEGSTFSGLELADGRLNVAADKVFSGTGFHQSGGTIGGSGTLQTTGFEWTGGTMDGDGLTQDLGTADIHIDNSVGAVLSITRRLETHDGAWTSGRIEGRNRAVWTITGTFDMRPEYGSGVEDGDYVNHDNSERTKIRVAPGGRLVKTATHAGSPGEITRTDFALENDGVVETSAGRLEFHGGGGESNGDFASTGAGRTALAGGTFTLGDNSGYDGFEVAGGRVEVVSGATFTGQDLWQTGGSIGGAGTLETTGTFMWTGGAMDQSGLTRSTGTTHIQPSGDIFLEIGRRFETKDGTWTGSGRMEVRNRAVWTNTGTFDIRAERGDGVPEADYVNHDNTAWPVLRNLGTIVRSAGSDSTDLQIQIDNDGFTDASSGRLTFTLGGGESTGSFGSTGSGRTVLAAETFTLGNGSFDGFEVAGGRVEVNPDKTYAGADLWQTGGTIGGAGTLESTGTFDWTGGEMDGSGLTRSTGTTHIHPSGQVVLGISRNLESKHGSWTGDGRFEVRNRAKWTVTGGFDMLAERADGVPELDYVNHDNTDWPLLRITGAVTRSAGSGGTEVQMPVDNDGTVETSSGRLRFIMGGGESTGSFASTGSGRTVLDGETFTIGSGSFDGFEVAGGTVNVTAGNTYTGADLWLTGGAIGGPGTLESTGAIDWTGGGMDGSGLTRSTGTTNIHPTSAIPYLGITRKLETNDGEWSSGRLELRNRAQWTSTGDFDVRGEDSLIDYVNHDNTDWPWIRNTGRLLKTAGTGNSDVDVPFENDGTVEVQSGRLRFTHGGGESAGAFTGTGDGRPVLAGGSFSSADSTFAGLEVAGSARLTVNADRTLSGTNLFMSGGTIAGTGDVDVAGTLDATGGTIEEAGTVKAANLDVHPPSDGTFTIGRGRRLETAGGAWRSGRFEFHNRAHWESTGTFDLRSESGWVDYTNYDNTAVATMHNAGSLTRTDASPEAPAVNIALELPIDNDGSISSQSGEIHLNGGSFGVATGSFQGVTLNGGNWTLGQGASFSTGGRINNAQVTLQDGANITMLGGTIDESHIHGDGDLLVPSGELVWHGGSINGSGLFHVAKDAKLIVDDAAGHYLTGRRLLQNEGELRWLNGSISVTESATLLNEGTLDVAVEGWPISAWGLNSAGYASFVNTGTIVKKAGTGSASLDRLDNVGLLDIRSGTIAANHLRQFAGGKVLATLAGTERGAQHGALDLYSARGLAGTVAVRLAAGYTPGDGDTFRIVHAGTDQSGHFTPENLTVAGGGTLTGAVDDGGMLTFTADMPAPEPPRAQAEPGSPAPDAGTGTEAVAVADSVVRLAPGREAVVAVPEGATVQVITKTKRAKVRFDRKARKLRVRLRRDARGKRLKLRYRIVAADGTRSRIATLTVRIARARR